MLFRVLSRPCAGERFVTLHVWCLSPFAPVAPRAPLAGDEVALLRVGFPCVGGWAGGRDPLKRSTAARRGGAAAPPLRGAAGPAAPAPCAGRNHGRWARRSGAAMGTDERGVPLAAFSEATDLAARNVRGAAPSRMATTFGEIDGGLPDVVRALAQRTGKGSRPRRSGPTALAPAAASRIQTPGSELALAASSPVGPSSGAGFRQLKDGRLGCECLLGFLSSFQGALDTPRL